MYLFAVFGQTTGILFKIVKPRRKKKVYSSCLSEPLTVKTVKCYPSYKAIQKEIKDFITDTDTDYLPKKISRGLYKLKAIQEDTLIDVETDTLAKLYVEVNKEELHHH